MEWHHDVIKSVSIPDPRAHRHVHDGRDASPVAQLVYVHVEQPRSCEHGFMVGTGTLRLRRDQQPWTDKLQRYKVVLDGEQSGKIAAGQTVEIPVMAGTHRLQLRIDWTGSPTVAFTVTDGQVAEFTCRPRRHALLSLLAIVESLFSRERWVLLERRT